MKTLNPIRPTTKAQIPATHTTERPVRTTAPTPRPSFLLALLRALATPAV